VRNFSFEEARRLDREWRMAHTGGRDAPQPNAVAEVRGTSAAQPKLQLRELADHVRRQLQSTPSAESREPMSGCVAGAKELSPSLEQQLSICGKRLWPSWWALATYRLPPNPKNARKNP
jgi:hypothetical protein